MRYAVYSQPILSAEGSVAGLKALRIAGVGDPGVWPAPRRNPCERQEAVPAQRWAQLLLGFPDLCTSPSISPTPTPGGWQAAPWKQSV